MVKQIGHWNLQGVCGLFVTGSHCSATGTVLKDAYNDIRDKRAIAPIADGRK